MKPVKIKSLQKRHYDECSKIVKTTFPCIACFGCQTYVDGVKAFLENIEQEVQKRVTSSQYDNAQKDIFKLLYAYASLSSISQELTIKEPIK
ncbi:MAG: hypothetical protein ACQCN3_02660 [Candidatus Bathyarchaeia archaeon]|jgi:Ni,Fe-hydrogenase I small subunit